MNLILAFTHTQTQIKRWRLYRVTDLAAVPHPEQARGDSGTEWSHFCWVCPYFSSLDWICSSVWTLVHLGQLWWSLGSSVSFMNHICDRKYSTAFRFCCALYVILPTFHSVSTQSVRLCFLRTLSLIYWCPNCDIPVCSSYCAAVGLWFVCGHHWFE